MWILFAKLRISESVSYFQTFKWSVGKRSPGTFSQSIWLHQSFKQTLNLAVAVFSSLVISKAFSCISVLLIGVSCLFFSFKHRLISEAHESRPFWMASYSSPCLKWLVNYEPSASFVESAPYWSLLCGTGFIISVSL